MRKNPKILAALTALVAVIALGGAYLLGHHAGSGAGPGITSVAEQADATGHNQTDTSFAATMVSHHRQAVEMARLAASRAGSAQVKALAATIEDAQGPEIETMSGWLSDWGSKPASSSTTHSVNGLMSASDMSVLAGKTGPAFDTTFLRMMVAHHEGAVTMAEIELESGRNADALALAASIVVSQQGQIAQMRAML